MLLLDATAPLTYDLFLRTMLPDFDSRFSDADEVHSPLTRASEFIRQVSETINAESQPERFHTNTMYKTAAKKMKPVDPDYNDGSVPPGTLHWKPDREARARLKMVFGHEWDDYILPRFTDMPVGQRFFESRKNAMLERVQGFLTPDECRMFERMLSNREAALAWDFPECGRIAADIFPPQEIRTVPHKAFQAKHVPIPRRSCLRSSRSSRSA